tara:strand:- start:44 stop:292 length:249 start_codon:yes stop_codon:yes gene_type:complete
MTEQDYEDEGFLVDDACLLHLDDCVEGYTDPGILVYNHNKIIDRFVNDGMGLDEAYEWVAMHVLPMASVGSGFVMLYAPREL